MPHGTTPRKGVCQKGVSQKGVGEKGIGQKDVLHCKVIALDVNQVEMSRPRDTRNLLCRLRREGLPLGDSDSVVSRDEEV